MSNLKSNDKVKLLHSKGWFGSVTLKAKNPHLELSAKSSSKINAFPDVFRFEEFQMFNGRILTVVEGILGGGQSSFTDEERLTTAKIHVNQALIGEYGWSKNRKVKSLRVSIGQKFRHIWPSNFLPDTDKDYIENRSKYRKLTRFVLNDVTYTLSLAPSFNGGLINFKASALSCKIDFKRKVTLDDAHLHVRAILSFFSFSAGERIYEDDLEYSDGVASAIKYVGGKTGRNIRKWHYFISPKGKSDNNSDQSIHSSLFPFYTNASAQKFLKVMESWVEAYLKEPSHSAAMVGCISRAGNSYNEGRLLRAFAWFESIPEYKIKTKVTNGQITKLINAAYDTAVEKRIEIDKQRIRECLNGLKFETLRDRMNLAVKDLKSDLSPLLKANFLIQLDNGIGFRNKIAHGSGVSESEVDDMMDATRSAEVLCYLICLERHGLLLQDVENKGSHSTLSYLRALAKRS